MTPGRSGAAVGPRCHDRLVNEVDDEPVRVTATLTRRQAVRLQATTGRVLGCVVAYLAVVVLPSAVLGGLSALQARWAGVAAAVLTAVVMAVAGFFPVLLRWWWVPIRRPHEAGAGVTVDWTFGPHGMACASRMSTADLAWTAFRDVRVRAGLLAMHQRGATWHMGVPTADLGDAAAEQVVAWWRAATATGATNVAARTGSSEPAGVPPTAPVVSRPDGDLLVRVGPSERRFLRLAIDPAFVVSLAEAPWQLVTPLLGVAALVAGVVTGDRLPTVAGAALVGLSLLPVPLRARALRRASRRPYPLSSYRVGPRSVGVAGPTGWVHVPWEQLAAVVLAEGGLVLRRRPPQGESFALPTAGLSADDLRDVVRWAAAHGLPVHDRRTTRSWLLGGRATADALRSGDVPTA